MKLQSLTLQTILEDRCSFTAKILLHFKWCFQSKSEFLIACACVISCQPK